jgi:hypothetical protein
MSFEQDLIKEFDFKFYSVLEGIKKDLIDMLKMRVPIESHLLQDKGLSVTSTNTSFGYDILIFVNDNSLQYENTTIKATLLGQILNIGVRGGKSLLRSKSQPKNSAGSPTSGWFSKDFQLDVENYFNSQAYKKWM